MSGGVHIAIVRPRNFRDAATVGEYYRQEIPVIINLEDMDLAEATRILDFVSGLILGRCGDIERLSRRAFLIVPDDATILTAHDGLAEEGFFNQALRSVDLAPYSAAKAGVAAARSGGARRPRHRRLGGSLERGGPAGPWPGRVLAASAGRCPRSARARVLNRAAGSRGTGLREQCPGQYRVPMVSTDTCGLPPNTTL